MLKAEIEKVLKETVMSCANEDGWANLAEIGSKLRQKGIHYGKLSRFLQGYSSIVETQIDYSVTPPAVYARLIN
jgi:hypothetical protein